MYVLFGQIILDVFKKVVEVIDDLLPIRKYDESVCDSNVREAKFDRLLVDKLIIHNYNFASFIALVEKSAILKVIEETQ